MKREPTDFEQSVYQAVSRVPRGKVVTYKTLANAVGCGSSQAVGQALKRNPFAPEVPCHRVINGSHKIAGYMGKTEGPEITKKRKLLAEEGVYFSDDGKLLDDGCLQNVI